MNESSIIISNLQDLYRILGDYENIIFQDSSLASIKDYLDAAYTGCSCRKKQNEDKAAEIYKLLPSKVNAEVISELKKNLNVTNILCFYENKHLFNL